MSTLTANGYVLAADVRPRSALGRIVGRIVAHRERQAEQATAGYLLGLDDAALAALGHDRARLMQLANGSRPFI